MQTIKNILFVFLIGFTDIGFSQTRVQQAYDPYETKRQSVIDTSLLDYSFKTNDLYAIRPYVSFSKAFLCSDNSCWSPLRKKWVKKLNKEDSLALFGVSFTHVSWETNNGKRDTTGIYKFAVIEPVYYMMSKREKASSLAYLRQWILAEEKKLIKK